LAAATVATLIVTDLGKAQRAKAFDGSLLALFERFERSHLDDPGEGVCIGVDKRLPEFWPLIASRETEANGD